MSIFGIIALTFLVALLIFAVASLICVMVFENNYLDHKTERYMTVAVIVVSVCLWFVFIPIGIGINTECHEVWIAGYEAQKETIEASIESENLSGLERLELVAKASELNGELATRKAEFNLWHHVTFDDTLYDGVESIQIK